MPFFLSICQDGSVQALKDETVPGTHGIQSTHSLYVDKLRSPLLLKINQNDWVFKMFAKM